MPLHSHIHMCMTAPSPFLTTVLTTTLVLYDIPPISTAQSTDGTTQCRQAPVRFYSYICAL